MQSHQPNTRTVWGGRE